MIDTLHLKLFVNLDPDLLRPEWVETKKTFHRGRPDERVMIKYERKITLGWSTIFLRYYPSDYSGKPLLFIEISSLPKVIFPSNVPLLEDDRIAFKKINICLRSLIGFPPTIDILQAVIERIDIAHDSNVGDDLRNYFDVISQLIYPYKHKTIFCNTNSPGITNGIWFSSKKGSSIKFYDKGLESGFAEFTGVLRQESCVRGVSSLRRSFGDSSITLGQISKEMMLSVLMNDLVHLRLDRPIYGDEDTAFNILVKKYDKKTAFRLRDTLNKISECKELNLSVICCDLGIKKSTFYKRVKLIREAGIVSAVSNCKKELQPLSSYLVDEFSNNFQKIASDTRKSLGPNYMSSQ